MQISILLFGLLFFLSNPHSTGENGPISQECTKSKAIKSVGEQAIYTVYWKYQYDDEGRVARRDLVYADGQLKWAYAMTYDEQGNLIRRQRYDENNRYDGYYSLIYNANNELIEEIFFDKNDRQVFRYQYTNRSDGKPIRHDYYNANDQLTEYWTYAYNEKGQNTEKKVYQRGSDELESVFKMFYDERGNEWKYVRTDEQGRERYSFYYSFECD